MARESSLFNMVMTLFVICLLSSAILGVVYAVTKEPIEASKVAKTNTAISKVVSEFDNDPSSEVFEGEMAKASNPMIRCFDVHQKYNFKAPQQNYTGNPSWKEVNAETVLSYSAVAYFFATEINRIKNVPVGLNNASLGGSPVQAWMSEDALKAFPAHLEEGYRWRNY